MLVGDELIEVISGNSPRDIGKTAPNLLFITEAQVTKTRHDLTLAAAAGDLALHLLNACPADAHTCAVVQKNVERLGVIRYSPIHRRVHAARVISEHAPERTAGMRSRV